MNPLKEVLVLGAGGHAKVLIEILKKTEGIKLLGLLVNELVENTPQQVLEVPILGTENKLNRTPKTTLLVNGIGSTQNMEKRTNLFEKYKELGYSFLTVIHPSAVIGSGVLLGEGTQVMAGSVIQTGSVLGSNCIVNTGAIVDHDCEIGSHVHLSPGVTLSGGVKIGNGVHVGTGATIIQYLTIGERSTIGAGAVVTKNIAQGVLAMGVPARIF